MTARFAKNRARFASRVAPVILLAIVVTSAVACSVRSERSSARADRLSLLDQAFAIRAGDPEAAASLFTAAGAGAELERARLDAWFECLGRFQATSDQWRSFLAARPPAALAASATLALADALVAENHRAEAVAVLVDAPETARQRADVRLLEIADPAAAASAARRLASSAPQRLRGHSPALEREILKDLDHDDWMARAAAWRAAGSPSRGAAELRGIRSRGEEEVERRLELGRCELEAGSTSRALGVLPSGSEAGPVALALGAEAYRRRGWNNYPDSASGPAFRSCVDLAGKALSSAAGPPPKEALELMLECGTEAGTLDSALDAWWRLEASGWQSDRRSWLGRRLGVALAQSGGDPRQLAAIAGALPDHERCLLYWHAAAASDVAALDSLAQATIADLYGRWSRQSAQSGRPPAHLDPMADVGAAGPPPAVAWLLEHATEREASDEWQRTLERRPPERREAMAAAALAARAGLPNTAIRTLRQGFPELGSVTMAEAPGDAIRAYLPLRWPEHLAAAARETGVDPWLIAAVARQESVFTAHARSPAGARGVLQLVPETGRLHSRALGLGSRPDLEDPAVNIRLGAHELAALIHRFGALEPALAAYNAGERRVRRWWRRWPDPRVFTESVPIPETYNYVRRVVFLADGYRLAYADVWRESS